MGFIVDDHERNIHGELRRESFTIFSDFGKEWSVELDLKDLEELLYVLTQIKAHRDEAKQYPEHRKFHKPAPKPNCRNCDGSGEAKEYDFLGGLSYVACYCIH